MCFPLMRPADPGAGHAASQQGLLAPHGPPELTPLVTDPEVAARLEADVQYGGGALSEEFGPTPTAALLARLPRLQAWIREVVDAAGLPPVRAVLPPSENPLDHRTREGLVAVVGAILYVTRDPFRPSVEASLRHWAEQGDGLADTAFARLYDAAGPPPASGEAPVADGPEPVRTPLPLSAAQADAVRRARHERGRAPSRGRPAAARATPSPPSPPTPSTRGGSVLIATRSEHAAVRRGRPARPPGRARSRSGSGRPIATTSCARRPSTAPAPATARRARRGPRRRGVGAGPRRTGGHRRALDLEASAERAMAWDGARRRAAARWRPGRSIRPATSRR